MHLAAGRHTQHRDGVAHRVHQVTGGAVAAGEQQQLGAGVQQRAGRLAAVGGVAGDGEAPITSASRPASRQLCSPMSPPGEHAQVVGVAGHRLQGAGHARHRHGRGAAPQGFLAGGFAIAALEAHGAADAGERVHQNTKNQSIARLCHKTITPFSNNDRVGENSGEPS